MYWFRRATQFLLLRFPEAQTRAETQRRGEGQERRERLERTGYSLCVSAEKGNAGGKASTIGLRRDEWDAAYLQTSSWELSLRRFRAISAWQAVLGLRCASRVWPISGAYP